jgi:hypothetical protein
MTANGDCYEANGKAIAELFMQHSKDARVLRTFKLVHGDVIGAANSKVAGKQFGHAWIEIDGQIIVDHSNGKSHAGPLSAVEYRIIRPTCKYYSPEEVAKNLLKFEHYGPWTKEETK